MTDKLITTKERANEVLLWTYARGFDSGAIIGFFVGFALGALIVWFAQR